MSRPIGLVISSEAVSTAATFISAQLSETFISREMLEMVSKEMSQMVSVDKTRMQTAEIANRGFLKVNCTAKLLLHY